MKNVLFEQADSNTSAISGIVDRPPCDLSPWPGNPRTHSDKQLVKLKASIQKFGFTAPVLVDEAGEPMATSRWSRVKKGMSFDEVKKIFGKDIWQPQ